MNFCQTIFDVVRVIAGVILLVGINMAVMVAVVFLQERLPGLLIPGLGFFFNLFNLGFFLLPDMGLYLFQHVDF